MPTAKARLAKLIRNKKYGKTQQLVRRQFRKGLRRNNVQFHKYIRWAGLLGTAGVSELIQTITVEAPLNLNFRLGDTPNQSEFQNLYDMYKLDKVVVHIIPQFTNESMLGSGADVNGHRLFAAIDYDGSAVTTINEIRQYANCRELNFFKRHRITIRPKVKMPTFTTGTTLGSVTANRNPWVDAVNTETEYWGLILVCSAGTANFLQRWQLEAQYFFTCKNTR